MHCVTNCVVRHPTTLYMQVVKGPKYSIAYANLCKVMSTTKVRESTTVGGSQRDVTFLRILISKLQQEFERNKDDDEEREGLLRAIEAAQDVSSGISINMQAYTKHAWKGNYDVMLCLYCGYCDSTG